MQELLQIIREAAQAGRTEEDLKLAMEPKLQEYMQRYEPDGGMTAPPSYEVRTGLAGRRDAVYGFFTLEYKRPGYLGNSQNQQRAAQQLAEYLEAAAGGTEDGEALKRVAGACTDGRQIFFMRYWPEELLQARQYRPRQLKLFGSSENSGGFQVLGPYEVNAASLEELFRYLRALGRRPLQAEVLADVFGPGSSVAQQIVAALYKALEGTSSHRVQTLYRQWEHVFGITYGEETAKAERDVPELAAGYALPEDAKLKPSLFVVHTYFALIMKLLAAEILALQEGSLSRSLLAELPGLDSTSLRARLIRLEAGEDYHVHGIHNFLEGDFFRWYLDAWDEAVGESLQALASSLAEFEPTTPTLRPEEARDLLKKLYQYLVPKQLRHDLGEYYTPDWLAERLLNQLGYVGNPETRLLDPACGSGTFLTLALARVRERMELELWDRDPLLRQTCAKKVLENIVGFDLNPLAVIAARTNYLLAFGDLIRYARPVEIPVYNCDAILTPVLQKRAAKGQLKIFDADQDFFYLPTVVGEFRLPMEIIDQKALKPVTALLEECIAAEYSRQEFLQRIGGLVNLSPEAQDMLGELYDQLASLEAEGRNGIWVRLLRNSFAPVLQEPFDVIAGNPPWVNWEYLPQSWRELSKDLWEGYGLFSLEGYAARLGGGKKDLAMLFTYACSDYYLKPKGQLGFVITQTVFKTKGAGDGFRRFRLGEKGEQLKVKAVDDLSDLQPFEGATNRTAILTLIKGMPTRYPVPYTVWERAQGQRIAQESTLQEVSRGSRLHHQFARPVDPASPTSPWLTASRRTLSALEKVMGPSPYRAYAGSCTWLNGVYWVRLVAERPDGLVVIENLGDVGRKKVPTIQAAVEPDLLYPLLRGRDVQPWHAAPNLWLILTQDPEQRTGWPEGIMKMKWPYTYQYLRRFQAELAQRSGLKKYFNVERDAVWSIYNVGTHTIAPYKVVWREQASVLTCALVSSTSLDGQPEKVVVPDHKLMFVPAESLDEAGFIAALLGSRIAQLAAKSYALETSTSAHLMEHIAVPAFDPSNQLHRELAAAAIHLHRDPSALGSLQGELDRLAAAVWDLTDKELQAVVQEMEQ